VKNLAVVGVAVCAVGVAKTVSAADVTCTPDRGESLVRRNAVSVIVVRKTGSDDPFEASARTWRGCTRGHAWIELFSGETAFDSGQYAADFRLGGRFAAFSSFAGSGRYGGEERLQLVDLRTGSRWVSEPVEAGGGSSSILQELVVNARGDLAWIRSGYANRHPRWRVFLRRHDGTPVIAYQSRHVLERLGISSSRLTWIEAGRHGKHKRTRVLS
jgi:hypothetical protein